MRHSLNSGTGGGHPNFMTGTGASPAGQFALAAGGPGGEAQAMFDWEGILQTIGSGWTGDGTLETGMESLFG